MKITKIILILTFFSICGCGKNEAQKDISKIRFAFWGSPEEVEIITATIKEWERKNPNVDVVLEHTPYGGYISKILTRIAGGDAPDIIAAEVGLFTNFWSKGVFLNLSPFIETDSSFSIQDYFPEIVNHFSVDGQVYGIPRDIAPFACIFYNKKLFDAAGIPYPNDDWSWDELLNIAQKLTIIDAEGKVKRYGFYTWAWQNFILSNGGMLVDNVKNPQRLMFDSPESKQGLSFFSDLILKYRVSPTPSALINMGMGVQMMFMTERLAMLGSGIWETPALRKIESFDWDVVMFPKNNSGIRRFATGGTGYCILKGTQNPQLAWEVLKALTSKKAMQDLASMGLAQPAMIEVAKGSLWAQNNEKPYNKGMLNEAVQYVVFPPFHPKWREAEELYVKPALDLIFNGTKSIDEVVPNMNAEGTKLLNE